MKSRTWVRRGLLAALLAWHVAGCGDDDHDHDHPHAGSGGRAGSGGAGGSMTAGSGGAGGSAAGSGGAGGSMAAGSGGTGGSAAGSGGAGGSMAAGSGGAEAGSGGDAGDGPDAGVEPAPGAEGYLLVAELAADVESIHVYSLPDLTHTGTIQDVLFGNHVGAIALADGRVVTTDDKHGDIIAIRMDAEGVPQVVHRVPAAIGPRAMWGCGDEQLDYLAISSGRPGLGDQAAFIVKLDDFTVTPFEVAMNVLDPGTPDARTEELHPFIAGEPPHLFVGIGGEIQAYPLAAVLEGTATAPVASLPVETGSHGPVVTHTHGRLYISARAGSGLDGVSFADSPFARVAEIIPWDADGRSSNRNGRPRLSWDGRYIYGAITQAQPSGAENWAAREVDFHAADLDTQTARRFAFTTGIVPKFQLSRPYAFFANITEEGDFGVLIDVDAASSSFHEVVARVPLEALENGPTAGESTAGTQARGSAITPDGKWAFVSHGGEGKVSVIDTAERAVVATLETPTALSGGGYLLAIQPGTAPIDTCTR